MWRDLAIIGEAKRSEYTLRLSIPAYEITIRERDDEPMEASKEELERFRMVAELREKVNRTMSSLEGCGHTWSISTGFSLPELLGRWWSRATWEEWKSLQGDWEEELIENEVTQEEVIYDNDIIVPVEGMVKALLIKTEEPLTSNIEKAPYIQEQCDLDIENDSYYEKSTGSLEIAEIAFESKEEIEALTNQTVSKVNKKTNKVTKVISKIKQYLYMLVSWLKGVYRPVHALLGKLYLNRKSEQRQVEAMLNIASAEDGQAQEKLNNKTISEEIPFSTSFSGVYFMISPTSTGKSFLTTNMAVAHSRPDQVIHVVDLARDKGCLSLLNPLSAASTIQGWECWHSPHAPHLFLWTPTMYPDLSLLQTQLLTWSQEGSVFVDLPYHYPERDQLLEIGQTVGIFDTDYHHWLQWEKEHIKLDLIWLNQADQKMKESFSPLLQERFGQAPAICVPYFSEAAWWCFQGRPLAVQPRVKAQFQ
jgi:hypothetical protein